MSDMKAVIVPKSDQLNADDLIAGPITIKIADVTIRGGQEQPISVHYEGDNGKPYKPCKSMCRVMVTAWGADSKKYIGRTMTLYRDEKVKWAGMEVGGIRVSHMSDIDSAITMALTVTRANKKPFTVRPIADHGQAGGSPKQDAPSPRAPDTGTAGTPTNPDAVSQINAALGFASPVLKNRYIARLATAGVKSTEGLSAEDQKKALDWLKTQIDKEAATTT